MTANQLQDLLQSKHVYATRVHKVAKGPMAGCFCVRKSYFYKQGQSAGRWATEVMAALLLTRTTWEQHGVSDDWVAGPKQSYFTVYIKQGDPR